MPSIFPDDFDTDLEIPRVDAGVTEINGDIINSLRDAIFAMQRAIGLDGQGNKPSLVDRINVAIDPNGNINREALEVVGLVTLPIVNRHVGDTAGIVETKLRLDYSTQTLRNLIASLRTDLDGALAGLSSSTAAFNAHLLGTGNFHDGYQIKINNPNTPQIGVAGLESITVGDALNEIAQILLTGNGVTVPHIDTGMPNGVHHRASSIAVDTTNFSSIDRAATNVQTALDSIDAEAGALGREHGDSFHANGILKSINSGTHFNPNRKLYGPKIGAAYTEGTSVIQIPDVTSFADLGIRAGDILEIVERTGIADSGVYQIRATGPLTSSQIIGNLPELAVDELAIFYTFTESRADDDSVEFNIYSPASVSSEVAPLACSVRYNGTIVDTITVMNPDAARVVSVGFNNSIINSDGYDIAIRAGIGNGETRDIIIPFLNRERLGTGQAQPVSASSVAERINAYVSDPNLGKHFPISAYRIGNEIAIAHNLVGADYTIEIVDGYSGNFPMGLDAYGAGVVGLIAVGNENNSYSVNGVARSDVRVAFDGYAEITANSNNLMLWSNSGQLIDPTRFGIKAGSVMHVTGHPLKDSNGSYTIQSVNTTTVSTFPVEPILVATSPTRFNVLFTDSHVSLADFDDDTDQSRGIAQLYINSDGRTLLHQRLHYGDNLGSAIEIVDISHNFPVGQIVLNVALSGDDKIFTLIDNALPGEPVQIPDGFDGKFKLYHPNNIDFLVMDIIPGTISGGIEVVTISPPQVLDEAMELCSVHFDGTLTITNITDTRLFGNMSANEVRDDFIEVFSQRPVDDLRSNGVVRGFDLMDIPYLDDISQMQALPIRGGTAYVNGVRVTTETQKVIVPSYDEEGLLLNDARRVIGINEFGSIQSYSDELGEILSDGYASSVRFGKILPLYRINITAGGITDVVDLRLFINNLDDKIDLIVDETNNVVGNFRTLEGALLYAENYPGAEKLTVRIMNTVTPSSAITVPRGVSLLGNSPYGGDSKHQIIADTAFGNKFITLSGDNRLENLEISAGVNNYNETLVFVNGSNVIVDKCLMQYEGTVTSDSGDVAIEIGSEAINNVRITNNHINNVFTGIAGLYGTERLFIVDNEITELAGTGGISVGISLGTASLAVDSLIVRGNTIKVPDLASASDVRGIQIDVANNIKLVRLDSNYIQHDDLTEMTNGIRIESVNSTNARIRQLYITDNYINGIKMDDNEVFGMYIKDVDDLIIEGNKLQNIGVDGDTNNDVAVIRINSNVINASIVNNILKDCDVGAGIELEYGDGYNNTGRTIVANNILRNLGTAAWHITTNVSHSNITGNTLVGPSSQGIRVTGTRSIVSNNHLSKPNDGSATDYAFSDRAIHIQTSDVDVMNNSITGMEYSQLSIGITNVNTSRERIKIVGNTISGTKMAQLIQLYGSGHVVCDNRLLNAAKADSTDSFFIELNTVSTTLISGNVFQGEGTRCITNRVRGTTTDTLLSNTTIVNNDVNVEFSGNSPFGPILLQDTTGNTVTACLVANNRIPVDSPSVSRIGVTSPTSTIVNSNVIGINVGLTDTTNIPFNSAITTYNVIDGYSHPHWIIEDTNDYWSIATFSSNEARTLYFPISGPPNGAKLVGVRVTGEYGDIDDSSTFTLEVFKKSMNQSNFPVESLSLITDPNADLRSDSFGQRGGIGDVNLTSEEVINYDESSYFVAITSTGVMSQQEGRDTQIHGLIVTFRY